MSHPHLQWVGHLADYQPLLISYRLRVFQVKSKLYKWSFGPHDHTHYRNTHISCPYLTAPIDSRKTIQHIDQCHNKEDYNQS